MPEFPQRYDLAIIGGVIVGLATAFEITQRYSGISVTILEKEHEIAYHQTGHNSGVIYSGVYYKPGSVKAQSPVRRRSTSVQFALVCKSPRRVA